MASVAGGMNEDRSHSEGGSQPDARDIELMDSRPTGTPGIRKRALLFGVNTYSNRGFSFKPLKYAVNDVVKAGELLRNAGWEVDVFTSSSPESACQPTRRVILDQLGMLPQSGQSDSNAHPRELLLLAFSGHGAQFSSGGNSDIYFYPMDANGTSAANGISLQYIIEKACRFQNKWRADRVVLILKDDCRLDPTAPQPNPSGPQADESGTRAVHGNVYTGELPDNCLTLLSCSAGEKAVESAAFGGGHGAFFFQVIEGLEGKAKDATGDVTWLNLVSHVFRTVEASAAQVARGRRQTPQHLGNHRLNPVLVETRGEDRFPDPPQLKPVAGAPYFGTLSGTTFVSHKGQPVFATRDAQHDSQTGGRSTDESSRQANVWIGDRNITIQQHQQIMGTSLETQMELAGIRRQNETLTPLHRPDHPMRFFSPEEIEEFCKRLTQREQEQGILHAGMRYRPLFTDEWMEMATSGGLNRCDRDEFSLEEFAWFSRSQINDVMSVGLKQPSAGSYYDWFGNVHETTRDRQSVCGRIVYRLCGGSFRSTWEQCKADYFHPTLLWSTGQPPLRRDDVGFRIVLEEQPERVRAGGFLRKLHGKPSIGLDVPCSWKAPDPGDHVSASAVYHRCDNQEVIEIRFCQCSGSGIDLDPWHKDVYASNSSRPAPKSGSICRFPAQLVDVVGHRIGTVNGERTRIPNWRLVAVGLNVGKNEQFYVQIHGPSAAFSESAIREIRQFVRSIRVVPAD